MNKAFEAGRAYAAYESDLQEMFNDWVGCDFETRRVSATEEAWLVLRQIESDITFASATYIGKIKRARIIIGTLLAERRVQLLNGVTDD